MAKLIEGIYVDISFGHYEESGGDEDPALFVPDFIYNNEITSLHLSITGHLAEMKKEVDLMVRKTFAKFIKDYGAS